MTKEKPILFCGEMVRAILVGLKTQTRRVVKHNEKMARNMMEGEESAWCPYGGPGTKLWVRETWAHNDAWYEDRPGMEWKNCHRDGKCTWVYYAATYDSKEQERDWPWRPSIFMPRWASRITLEVTEVRVERIQEITEADAIAEGTTDRTWTTPHARCTMRDCYRKLWDPINKKRGFGWDSNPFVWVVSFKPVEAS